MLPTHWQHPELLWLMLPLLAYVWYLSRYLNRPSDWETIADPQLIKPLMMTAAKPKRLDYGLLALIWLLTTLALAGPSWQLTTLPLYQNQQATILVASLNDSMLANDLPPTRLARMRYKLLDSLKLYGDGQTGMIAFAGEPYVVSPLTQDSQTIANLVGDLSPDLMPVAGNDLSAALQLAKKMLTQSGLTQGHIVVFTADSADNAAIATAKTLAAEGITTSVLGVATPLGAPLLSDAAGPQHGQVVMSRLDVNTLQALAQAGHGQFRAFTANDADLSGLFASTDQSPNQVTRVPQKACLPNASCINTLKFWHNQGYWLIWLCIPLVLLAFRRGSPWLDVA